MTDKSTGIKEKGPSVESKIKDLYELQRVDSDIDKIRILRGELPLEVQDLEDELAGLETRVKNFEDEVVELDASISKKNNEIADAQGLIKKYETQRDNVRNNREYESLSKEIEFQTLEIQLCEKRIKEFTVRLNDKKTMIEDSNSGFEDRKGDLDAKKMELDAIVAETQKEEENLITRSEKISKRIEDRLLSAYNRIRKNARNGLAVVSVERDACGGCFNRIPPQRQLDIGSRKKIIVCEYCGRVLVDADIMNDKATEKEPVVEIKKTTKKVAKKVSAKDTKTVAKKATKKVSAKDTKTVAKKDTKTVAKKDTKKVTPKAAKKVTKKVTKK